MQTAVEWFYDQITRSSWDYTTFEEAKEMEREIAITFHQWMQINNTEQNAEKYANYSDEDMFDEFLK
jgi:hypothetical protein